MGVVKQTVIVSAYYVTSNLQSYGAHMEFNASSVQLLKINADSLVLPTGSQLENVAKEIDEALDGAITSLIESEILVAKLLSPACCSTSILPFNELFW